MKNCQTQWLANIKRPFMAVIIIMTAAVVLRFVLISADFPLFLSSAQDEVYDAPWYVEDAQYIVQGRELMHDCSALKALWTGYFTMVFYLLGPGVWQGNTGAALLGVACVWLVFAAVRKTAGRMPALVAMLLAATNFILVMYSRTPLPYIGVCAGCLLCVYLWLTLQSKPGYLFIPYVLAVVFAFHLKSVAGVILPVMVIADALMLLKNGRKDLIKRALPYIIAGIAATAVFLVEYQLFRGSAGRYVEHRFTAYVGEVSFMESIRGILSLGFESRYFIQMPVAAFLAFLYPVLLARRWRQRSEGELRLGIACVVWMLGALAAFGFLKYRSLHYFIVMSPAMLILAALCIRELIATRRLGAGKPNLVSSVLGFLLITYLAYQAVTAVAVALVESGNIGDFLSKSVGLNIHSQAVTLTNFGTSWALLLAGAVALLIVAAWKIINKKLPEKGIEIPTTFLKYSVVAIIGASVLLNLSFFIRFSLEPSYSMVHVPREIPALAGPGAKITEHGSSLAGYGNPLTIKRAGFNFMEGKAAAGNSTHLFVNFFRLRLVRPVSALKEGPYARPVAMLTVKKVPALLYRIKALPSGYSLSAYEEGEAFLHTGEYQKALGKFRAGIKEHPESGVLRRSAGVALYNMGKIEEAGTELRCALELLPEDYVANSYIAACLTKTGRYNEAMRHLEWMKNYYELDINLKRLVFEYGEILESQNETVSDKLLDLLSPILIYQTQH